VKRVAIGAAAAVTAVGAAVAGQRLTKTALERSADRSKGHDRWHSVTVYRSPEDLRMLPDPLAALGDTIEVRMRPAPAGRGTELAVRLRGDGPADRESVWRLRRALREAKQLAEIGEVVLADQPGTTERTLLSRPLEFATRHGREGGRL
jgi:hypothetical protein